MAINPYYPYMAEAEGYLDTRESKIRRVIADVKRYPDPVMSQSAFETVCKLNGLNPYSLSERELRRIKTAVGG